MLPEFLLLACPLDSRLRRNDEHRHVTSNPVIPAPD